MGQERSAEARTSASWAVLAGAAVASAQTLAWAAVAAPPLGRPTGFDPVPLAALALSMALGAGSAPLPAGLLGRLLPAAVAAAGGGTAWVAAPQLAALPVFGPASLVGRFMLALLAVGPAGYFCAARLRTGSGVPFWSGCAALVMLFSLVGDAVPPLIWLAGAPLLWLLVEPPARAPAGSRAGSWSATLVPAVVTGFLAVAVAAWGRFLVLALLGAPSPARGPLLPLTLGALAGILALRWLTRGGLRPTPSGLVPSALLAAAVVSLWGSLAAGWLVETALGLQDSGWPPEAALLPAALVLAPLALLGVAGLGGVDSGAGAPPVRAMALGLAAGLTLEGAVLAPLLGPGRLLRFSVPALALGAALPGLLSRRPAAPLRWRLVAVAAAAGLSLAALPEGPVRTRMLAAGVPWQPEAFLVDGRPALADRLGLLRVLRHEPAGAGLLVVRRASGQPEELAWQGWGLARADPVERACAAAGGALAALLHPAPGRALLLGDDGGGAAVGLLAVAPDLELIRTRRAPGRLELTGEVAAVPPATETGDGSGEGGLDLILIQPLPPQATGSGLAWSQDALARARGTLSPGGVVALAVPVEGLSQAGFRRMVATFTRVFPAASLWFDGQGLLLAGGAEPVPVDLAGFERRFRAAMPSLLDCGLARPADLLGRLVAHGAGLADLAAGAAPERARAPRLGLEARRRPGEAVSFLADLRVAPAAAVGLLRPLSPGESAALHADLTPVSQATQHLLIVRGLAATDLQAAVEHAQAAVALRPGDRLASRTLASLAAEAAGGALIHGQAEEALAWAEQAVDLDPTQLAHHLRLYSLLEQAGRSSLAQRRLSDMAVRFPDAYPVLLAQAWRRLDQGDVNAADAFLQRAGATGYETFELPLGLARVALARRQDALAGEHLARALAIGPDPGQVLAQLGAGLLESDPQRAAAYLRRARDMGRDAADVNGPLGRLALQDGDPQAAIPLLEKAVGQVPLASVQQARLRLDLGSSLLLASRAGEAIPHLEEAARLAPGEPIIRLNLAAALAREGRREDARRQLERIGDRLEGNPVLQRLRRDLGMGGAEAPAPDGT